MAAFVLMKQNRMSKIADRRAHLDLQINLMTERETTKIIGMLLEIGKRLDIQHKVLDEESRQLSRLLAIETLIDTMHSKFPDEMTKRGRGSGKQVRKDRRRRRDLRLEAVQAEQPAFVGGGGWSRRSD